MIRILKYLSALILLIALPIFSFSQQNKIDSLKHFLQTNKKDTTKINTLIALCKEYKDYDYTIAIKYGHKALALARQLNEKKAEATSLNLIAGIYIYQGEYSKAMSFLMEALKIEETINNKLLTANVLNNIGNVHYYQQNLKEAIVYYHKSLDIEKELGNQIGVAKGLYNIGMIYEELEQKGNYKKAVEYYELSLKIFEELGNKKGIAYLNNNLGSVNETLNKFEEALEYLNKSLENFEEIGDKKGVSVALSSIGLIYFKQKKYEQSAAYLDKALLVAKEINSRDIIMQIHQNLGEINFLKGDYKKAYEYNQLYSTEKDSLLNEESSKQIAEMNAKYETETKQKEIEKQAIEIEKKNANIAREKTQKFAFIGGFVLMLILLLVIYKNYTNKKNATVLLIKQKNEIEENLKYTKKLQEALKIDLSHYIQISLRKLMNPHFVFNSLNSIQSFILQNDKLEASMYLSKFSELMRNVLEYSQQENIPLKDELKTLTLYIELEEKRFEDKFSFSINVDQSIDQVQSQVPPLIFQPFVENAIIHGLMHKEKGGELKIAIKKEDSSLICTIEDNGIGRDKAKKLNKTKKKHESFGIKATNQRLKIVNSLNNTDVVVNYFDLKDDTGKSLGTKVEFALPYLLIAENAPNA
jgi:tetratricopeptide (TPR) repeat protein